MASTSTNPAPDRDPNPTYGVVATVVCAGLVTALSLYLAGGLIVRFMPAKKCNDANPCDSGLRCDEGSGKCVKPPPGQMLCHEGDPEGTCFCPAPKSWIDGECQYKPPPPAECDAATSQLRARGRVGVQPLAAALLRRQQLGEARGSSGTPSWGTARGRMNPPSAF